MLKSGPAFNKKFTTILSNFLDIFFVLELGKRQVNQSLPYFQ